MSLMCMPSQDFQPVQLVAQLYSTLHNIMDCSTPGFPVLPCPLEPTQTHVHHVGDVIQPSHPLLPPSPPAFNPSQHQGLFQCAVLPIRWPKHWTFSFSINPSNEYSGLISFRIDRFDLLAIQGTLKSLLQDHSSKTSILQLSLWSTLTSIHDYWKNRSFD